MEPGSVGIVETKSFTFGEPPGGLQLVSGRKLGPVTIAYETYGEPDQGRRNAILVLHALSGDAHAAGRHQPDDRKPGWWDRVIGPGKPLDTDRYYVISSNFIGGCKGSTGPSSINPETGKPYGLDFPVITVADMVRAQRELLRHLGIERLLAVIGGSLGGMQALQWTVDFPEMLAAAIPIATTSRLSPQGIALNEVARQCILADPNWNHGNYYGRTPPERGLALARMIGHITYLSDESMHTKFGRHLVSSEGYSYDMLPDFQVESYLHYQGDSFVRRFDANAYLFITKAMDYFDLHTDKGSLTEVFSRKEQEHLRFLVVSFTSDWLYPTYQSREIVQALRSSRVDVSYCELESHYGHDAFLLPCEAMERVLSAFLGETYQSVLRDAEKS
jgi:homoserine O-acetyltransferase